MSVIPQDLIQSYAVISGDLLGKCSKNIFIGLADNGNHYLDKGIREGSRLIFDADEPYKRGQLSCFMDTEKNLHLLTTRRKGYTHLGRLIGILSTF